MSAHMKEDESRLMTIQIGTQAATASIPGPKAHRKMVVKSVKLVNGAGIALDDTNYLVVELKIGSTVIASLSTKLTSPGKLCNQALVALVASGDMLGGTEYELASAAQLSVVATKAGTGVPTDAMLQLEVYNK